YLQLRRIDFDGIVYEFWANTLDPRHHCAVAHSSAESGSRVMTHELSIAKDFSRAPGGRVRADGPYAGETFRQEVLVPALRRNETIIIVLDGTRGYGSSFLEEAFGGLVRIEGFRAAELRRQLTLISAVDPSLVTEIWSYVDDAERQLTAR